LIAIKKIITIAIAKRTRRTRRDAIATIRFDLQRYFAAKQQEYLMTQSVIERHTTKRFCLRADTQR